MRISATDSIRSHLQSRYQPLVSGRRDSISLLRSIEVMPPRKPEDWQKFEEFMDAIANQCPAFVSVTCHGGKFDQTLATAKAIQERWGLIAMPHLPCRGLHPDQVRLGVEAARRAGIGALLVLRGDQQVSPGSSAFSRASDAISFIREQAPELFLAGACHPLGHFDDEAVEVGIDCAREKADAGLDLLIAQFVLDSRSFWSFSDRLRESGVSIPIVPGLLAMETMQQVLKAAEHCHVMIEPLAFDATDLENLAYPGLLQRQVRDMAARGAPGFHIYSMNRAACLRLPIWARSDTMPGYASVEPQANQILEEAILQCREIRGIFRREGSGARVYAWGRILRTRRGRAVIRCEYPVVVERELKDFVFSSARSSSAVANYADSLRDRKHWKEMEKLVEYELRTLIRR